MKTYDHKSIDAKWQQTWRTRKSYATTEDTTKEKCYVLDMFPYPSGAGLHVGHPKGYIATDVYARYKRMRGFNVLHPMGWDAFGLPAENYALKNKVHPRAAVEANVARFKEQLGRIGFDYDWDKEINTTDPEFYRWTQWIFVQLFKKGLAFESYEPINWCPGCKTGLANEDLDGSRCERCDSTIEKKPMRQWVLKITDYADRLLKDLDTVPWPEYVKEAQRNWIGRSEGASLTFNVVNKVCTNETIEVFTTRPDTLYGVTYVVLAPEHPLVAKLLGNDTCGIENHEEVRVYIEQTKTKQDMERKEGKEKTGVELKGVSAINPANGEKVPVWIADYVLASYGTGAVMAVPAHDERDFAFAKKYALPIRQVVIPGPDLLHASGALLRTKQGTYLFERKTDDAPYNAGLLTLFGGMAEAGETAEACLVRELQEELELDITSHTAHYLGCVESDRSSGRYNTVYLIDRVARDALVQHEGDTIEEYTVEEVRSRKDVGRAVLRALDLYEGGAQSAFTEKGQLIDSGLYSGANSVAIAANITESVGGTMAVTYRLQDWVFSRQRYWGEPIPLIHCEACGVVSVPEEDLPVRLPDVDSYEPTGTGESPLANMTEWVHTPCPTCGGPGTRETNTMPQWAGSSWYYLRYIDPHNTGALVDAVKEKLWSPVDVYVGGMEHATRHLIYARFWHKFLFDIGVVSHIEPFERLHTVGIILAEDGRKMSKRWGNVVNPDDMVERMGADALRMYEMFMGPFTQSIAWSTDHMVGARRFLERVYGLKGRVVEVGELSPDVSFVLHQTIKKVGADIESFGFNTAISQMMILVNTFEKEKSIPVYAYESLIRMLAPFAPHLMEELWESCGHTTSVHLEPWPEYDVSILASAQITIVVQVNGKVRDTFTVEQGVDTATLCTMARTLPKVAERLVGMRDIKEIVVPDRLVNFVFTQ
ncbi:MAG: leucine--tRNA ligase [Candidatus Pacebacteria bacterium]|nr:leucine--tRNA ligase [Candidatus Paceibacterota bacterium]